MCYEKYTIYETGVNNQEITMREEMNDKQKICPQKLFSKIILIILIILSMSTNNIVCHFSFKASLSPSHLPSHHPTFSCYFIIISLIIPGEEDEFLDS